MSKGTIVFAGALAQRPQIGGHTWVFLQYLLGFRRLGWDVLFLDRLEPDMCTDAAGKPCPAEASANMTYFREVMDRFGLGNAYCVTVGGGKILGLPRSETIARIKRSAALINVMGYVTDEEFLAAAPKRAFLDIDPGFPQMWCDLGLADVFAGHDLFITIGQNIGRDTCTIPTCGRTWITTPQPVVLEQWPTATAPHNGAFTSVVTWRGPFGPIEYKGRTYGLRVHEFRKYIDLPRRSGAKLELALSIHPSETKDIDRIKAEGWTLLDPASAAGDVSGYRTFVQNSMAELTIAKNIYVDTRGGWLSDRSICYLASGRPVVIQDTGLRDRYPTGKGMCVFSTPDEAVAAIADVRGNYPAHARAARGIAEEHFDSDKVLPALLSKMGVA